MKKLYNITNSMRCHFFFICTLLFCVSCSEVFNTDQDTLVHEFSFRASFPEIQVVDTKAVGESVIRLKWETGDKISVINVTRAMALGGSLTVDAEGYSDIFSGTITGTINPGDVLAFIYPCQNYTSETAFTPIDIDYSVQDTKNPKLAMIAHHTATGSNSFTDFCVDFSFQISFLRLNLSQLPINTSFSSVQLNNMNDKLTFSISDGSMVTTSSSVNDYLKYTYASTTDDRGCQTITMAILPTPSKTSRNVVVTTPKTSYTSYFTNVQLKVNKSYNTNLTEFVKAVITFKDDKVKSICVNLFDKNGDGEVSFIEAAAVNDLGVALTKGAGDNPFPTTITSFDELKYFTGLATIPSFEGYDNLESITIPENVTSIPDDCFSGCSSLTDVVILATTPPSIGDGAFDGLTDVTIHVPDDAVDDYKEALPDLNDQIESIPNEEENVPGGGSEGTGEEPIV